MMNEIEYARFMSKVDKTATCWLWTSSVKSPEQPYPLFFFRGRNTRGNRLIYQYVHNITLTRDQFVCHKCDNPRCVNPDHLFVGTNADNMIDCLKKGRIKSAKLKEKDVQEIRQLKKAGWETVDIAAKFSISPRHVNNLVQKKFWKDGAAAPAQGGEE